MLPVKAQDSGLKTQDYFVLTGPTASGKSAVALALAERLGAEILSMDSMKVYRGMDIGTEKPGAEARARVPHHLLDLCEVSEAYDTRRWLADLDRAAGEVLARGKRVLVEGGTVLYFRSLREGLFEGPGAIPALRARLEAEAAALGTEALHRRLASLDPGAASRIHPNDRRRLVRAIEVCEATGKPISELQRSGTAPAPGVHLRVAVIVRDRETLRKRIAERTKRMLERGLVEETRALAAREGGFGKTASQALGYRQALAHLAGELPEKDLYPTIRRETMQFARRQASWLRRLTAAADGIEPAPDEPPERTAARVAERWASEEGE